jgi:hypothetical protein
MALRVQSVLLLVVVGCAGCGVTEYENQLDAAWKRLEIADAENAALGQPIAPTKGEPSIFLRLPRCVRGTPTDASHSLTRRLQHHAWATADSRVPVLEMFVFICTKQDCPTSARLLDRVKEDVQAHAGRIPVDKPLEPEEFELKGENPALPQANVKVAYERSQLELQGERPLWPAPARADLPEGALCQYTYDVYMVDAGDAWIVIVFKELDRAATEKLWLGQGIAEAQVAALPAVDRAALKRERELSLATLRLGAAAEDRRRFWK